MKEPVRACVNCKHFGTDSYSAEQCLRPGVLKETNNLITGKSYVIGVSAKLERFSLGNRTCGRQGQFFEQRITLLDKIKGWFK